MGVYPAEVAVALIVAALTEASKAQCVAFNVSLSQLFLQILCIS